MRALNPRFERFDVAHVPAGAWTAKKRLGSKLSGRRESGGAVENTKNSGNEAKKCLKTKDVTFLSAVNSVRFEHTLAQNGA